jgi:ribonucleotide reductase alpha subunit
MNLLNEMRVTKRNGELQDIAFDKILERVKKIGSEAGAQINYSSLVMKVIDQLYDKIPTSKIDELTAEQCAVMSTNHPDFNTLASRIVISNHQKNTDPVFSNVMKKLFEFKDIHGNDYSLVSEKLWEFTKKNENEINNMIDNERDYLIDYFGFKTLERAYLFKINNIIVERIQYMWLRVAIGIHGDPLAQDQTECLRLVKETYDLMSLKYFTHATPTLFNAGTPRPQLSSCYLIGMEDDSIEGIYNTLGECAQISKYSGGIGLHIHNIRAKNSHIRGTNGKTDGIVPMLRVFNNTARYVNQSGKRNGSFAIYLEPWHADIEDFLELRKNHGDEELKARDLFYALWVPDIFMERVKNNANWSLFCPNECPGLSDVHSETFKQLYEKYETDGFARKTMNARDLWFKILDSQMETGTPYLLYKDAANNKSNQQNLGTIKSSNLCVAPETLVLTDTGNYSICDLEGQDVKVWNGEKYSQVTITKTGTNQPLLKVILDNDSTIECTHYHKFYVLKDRINKSVIKIDAKDLTIGMELEPYSLPDGKELISLKIKGIIDYGRITDTFCFTEPLRNRGTFNGVVTGQCCEIVEYSDPNETAVCNLASIALPTFVNKETKLFDYDKLHEVTKIVTNNLNSVIDINYYPTEKTRKSNMKHRPIGIGVQGLADTFILMNLPFHSEEAKIVNKYIFETIYHASLEKSNEIAIERTKKITKLICGPRNYLLNVVNKYEYSNLSLSNQNLVGSYASFVGSPASNGILQFDMWNITPSDRYDWELLKKSIIKYGLRNSLLTAPMPTASTSQILGFNECFEPFTSNLYTRRTLAGEFIVVNKYLMQELINIGCWDENIKNNIIANKGSIQQLNILPDHLKNKYKIVWEMPMKHLIDMAADRGAFICQSQSLNLWVEDPTYNSLTSMHFYSWKKGLKTGIYYLRRKAKHQAQQFTIQPESNPVAQEKDEICEMCSA